MSKEATAQSVEPAIDLLVWIAHLGGGVEDSLLPGMAFDLSHELEIKDQKLTKARRNKIAQIVAGVQGVLGELVVDVLKREIGQTNNERAKARRSSALSYLESGR